jgi:AmiR/NasT family two-component response regulator
MGQRKPSAARHVDGEEPAHLRVLIANERADRLDRIAKIVADLGHDVIARQLEVTAVGRVTREERPDVALVGLGGSREHALDLISQIVHEAACPLIALRDTDDPQCALEAANCGVFACVGETDPPQVLECAINMAVRRFAEFHDLEGAFDRRAVIERAKGILMARHGIDEQQAFELLRSQSHRTGHKLVEIAEAVAESHQLLPAGPAA